MEIFEDKEFKQQPYDVQKNVANNYFDQELADDDFMQLDPAEQDRIKTNFMKEANVYDDRIELANQISIDSQMATPEDGTATAPMPSLFKDPKQNPISLGDNLSETYRGNIDLDKRQLVEDGMGNYMTEHSITVTDDQGVHWIIPTIVNGKKLDNNQAVDYAMQTGEHLGQYHNLGDAEKAAESIHLRQQDRYKGQAKAAQAIKPYMGMINEADKYFNQDLEHFSKARAESRVETAFDYFKENIGEEYAKMDDEDRMTVLTAFFDQVVKPKEDELQDQHNMMNMFLKFADKTLYTLTDNKDYSKLAQARQYMQDKDKTTYGAVAGMAGSALPYVAVGIPTGLIRGLTPALLTDSALQGTLSVLEHARDDRALTAIATDVAIDTGVNLVTFGLVRKFAAGNMAKGDYDKAAQQLFGKNADQLDPNELAKFKEIEAKSKLRVAKESKEITPEQKAAIDEATEMFNKMAAEADAPKPDKTFSMKEGTVEKPPIEDLSPTNKKSESAKSRVEAKRLEAERMFGADEDAINEYMKVKKTNSKKNGQLDDETIAYMDKNTPLQPSPPVTEDEIAEAQRIFMLGGNDLGGSLGGLTLNEAAMYYDENMLGRKLNEKEKWARRILSAAGGAYAGRKFGGDKGTKMFVGAKPDEIGAFSDLHDKGVRKWIDDGAAYADAKEGVKKVLENAFSTADGHLKNAWDRFKKGEISKFDLDERLWAYEDRLKKAKRKLIKADAPNDKVEKIYDRLDEIGTMRQIFSKTKSVEVQDVLKHDELFKAEPHLKEMDVEIMPDDMMKGMNGSWDGKKFRVSQSVANDPKEFKSILLHEIQHGLQDKYNWARGGNTNDLDPEDIVETLKIKFGNTPFFRNNKKLLDEGKLSKREYYETVINTASQNVEGGFARVRFNTYKRLAGEQEARAVQAKLKHPDKDPYAALKAEEGTVDKPLVKLDRTRAASETADPFYSVAEQTIKEKMPKKAPVSMVKGLLKDVKADELEWSGINKFLEGKETVLKEDLLAAIKQPEIETKTLGSEFDSIKYDKMKSERQELEDKWRSKGKSIYSNSDRKGIRKADIERYDELDEQIKTMYEAKLDNKTKYEGYATKDVGTNYREDLAILKDTAADQREKDLLKDQVELRKFKDQAVVEDDRLVDEIFQVERKIDKILNDMVLWKNTAHNYDHARELLKDDSTYLALKKEKDELTKKLDDHRENTGKTVEAALTKITEKKVERNKAQDNTYQSNHWDDKNVLYHTRKQDVKIDDQKTLLVDEIQSDWHQTGRKSGYRSDIKMDKDGLIEGMDLSVKEVPNTREGSTREKWAVFKGEEKVTPNLLSKEKAVEYFNSTAHDGSLHRESKRGVPKAPFAKTWHEKAMKDIIAEAVEKGYDRVAWVSGKDQAKRYSLSTHAKEISVSKNYLKEGQFLINAKKAEGITKSYTATAEQLPDYLGKELAQKAIEDLNTKSTMRYSDLDLELGGEGMKGFYDKMLPKFTAKYIKKYGSKLEIKDLSDAADRIKKVENFLEKLQGGEVDRALAKEVMDMPEVLSNHTLMIESPKSEEFMDALGDLIKDIKKKQKQVWSFEVTPKMKEQVSAKGQALYTRPEAIGAMAGFEQDENGNWTYNVERGILGAVGAKLGHKALTSKQVQAILKAEFKRQGQKLVDKVLDSAFSPVKFVVDGKDQGKALPKALNTDAVPAETIIKAATGDKEAFDEVSAAVFSRTFERILNKNTGDQLKPMVLDKLMKNPDMVEEIAGKFGYKIRYFSSNPENVGKKIGKTLIEERPATRQKLKKQGYESGNIWVYDPYDTHGAFNDPEYTKAWRGIHELSHAITERMMQAKYGDSRRFGALGNNTKNPYDPTDPRTYKALSTEEAQRAVEWEDVAFRTQVKLLDSMGIKVDKVEAINDFNIAGSDTVIRTLTGDFSDPADFGVIPRKDTYKIKIKDVLKLLQNQEKELARHQGRIPTRGIDLDTWKQVSDKEIEAVIKESLDNPLMQPKKIDGKSAQISIEAVAGEEVSQDLKEMVQMLSTKDQAKYHEEMYKALTDQSGASIIAKKLGLEVSEYNKLAGVWKGEVNPVAQIQVKAEFDAAGDLTKEFKDKLDDMAEMYAVAFRQDGVGWHYPVFKGTNPADQNGIDFAIGKKITDDQAISLERLLNSELNGDFAVVSTEKGVRIINMDKLPNVDFHTAAKKALEKLGVDGHVNYFRAESNLVEGVKRGDTIRKNSLKRRSDLQEWFDSHIAEQVERVNKRFSNIARENGYIPKPEEKAGSRLNPARALRFLAEDIPFGILDGVDIAARGIQKAILKGKTIDEAIGDLLKKKSDNHIIDTIKKAVVQDYRLSDQYLALADKANIAVKRGEAEASRMFDALKDLDEDDLTSLHNFVAGESKEIPSHLKQLAAAGKKAILAKTRELVSLGLLPEDILKAYKDGYLHREYEKHLKKAVADMFFDQQKKLSKQYKRGKEITVTREEYNDHVSLGEVGDNIRDAKYVYGGEKNGKIILRRDWTAQERADMGEITNAAYTVPSTIMKLQRDISYGKFLADVATDPKLNGVVKTADEMLSIAGVSRKGDIPTRGTGYQLLSGSQYGKLEGTYVEDAVANDIRGFKESLYGDDKEIKEAWKSLLTEWKVAKTVKNPTAHMNNFVSNMVMSYYAGITPSKIGKNTINAIKEIKNKGAYFQEAEEIGLLGRSKLEEIRRVVDKPVLRTRSTMNKIARNIYMAEDSKMGSAAFKMYSLEDDVSRLALYTHYRKEGKSIEESMKLAGKVVFDYTKRMPPLLRGMRDTGLVPFISWTYKAIPLMFNTMFQRPSRYAALVGMYVLLDNKINENADKPEFMRGKYMTVQGNRRESTQIRIQSMTPYFDWITEPAESIRQIALSGIPQKGVEALTNRQFWNDQKISYRDGLEKAHDYGLWTFNSILPTPSYLGKMYNVGEAAANNGKQYKRNKLFKPRSTGEAAAGLFGINVRTYDKKEQAKRSREEKRKELRSR